MALVDMWRKRCDADQQEKREGKTQPRWKSDLELVAWMNKKTTKRIKEEEEDAEEEASEEDDQEEEMTDEPEEQGEDQQEEPWSEDVVLDEGVAGNDYDHGTRPRDPDKLSDYRTAVLPYGSAASSATDREWEELAGRQQG